MWGPAKIRKCWIWTWTTRRLMRSLPRCPRFRDSEDTCAFACSSRVRFATFVSSWSCVCDDLWPLSPPRLVLDVNGLLIDRRRKPFSPPGGVEIPPDVTVGCEADTYLHLRELVVTLQHFPALPLPFYLHTASAGRLRRTFFVYNRPFMRDFIAWALSNFVVGVWSSARQHNLQGLVSHIFGPKASALAFVWGQERCTYCGTVGGRHGKPIYIKELRRIWEEAPFSPFGPSNTLLIDDDKYKARSAASDSSCVHHTGTHARLFGRIR